MPNRATLITFDNLVSILKRFSLKENVNGALESKTKALLPSIEHCIQQHPFHAPLLLHRLSRVTASFENPIPRVCRDFYTPLASVVDANLHHIDPKGLSTLLSVYSRCATGGAQSLIDHIELRAACMLYIGARRISDDVKALDELVAKETLNLRQKLSTSDGGAAIPSLEGIDRNDYLFKFLNLEDNLQELVDDSKYHLDINLFDVAIIVANVQERAIAKPLIFRLASVYVMQPKVYLHQENTTSIVRILHSFKKFNFKDSKYAKVAIELVNVNAKHLNAKDISALVEVVLQHPKQIDALDVGIFVDTIGDLCFAPSRNEALLKVSVAAASALYSAAFKLAFALPRQFSGAEDLFKLMERIVNGVVGAILENPQTTAKRLELAGINIISAHLLQTRDIPQNMELLIRLINATVAGIMSTNGKLGREWLYEYNRVMVGALAVLDESTESRDFKTLSNGLDYIAVKSAEVVNEMLLHANEKHNINKFGTNGVRDICHLLTLIPKTDFNRKYPLESERLVANSAEFLGIFVDDLNPLDARDMATFIKRAKRPK